MWRNIFNAVFYSGISWLGLWMLGATLHIFVMIGGIVLTVIGGLGLIGGLILALPRLGIKSDKSEGG